MQSILQHDGRIDKRGVGLIAYLVNRESEDSFWEAREFIEGTSLPVIYEFFRKPIGSFGMWAVFRINGKDEVPDLSIPLRLERMPRDAVRIGDQAALRYWLENGTEKPETGLAIHRPSDDDAILQALLGHVPTYDFIPGTTFHRLYEFELKNQKDWHQPHTNPFGFTSFATLPPGATAIPDQAALRWWLDRE